MYSYSGKTKYYYKDTERGTVERKFLKEKLKTFTTAAKNNYNVAKTVRAVDRVIFNPPATILIMDSGEKIVVKATEGDEFQPEIGFAMAIMKGIFKSRSAYKKYIEQFLPKEEEKEVNDLPKEEVGDHSV